MAAYRAALVEYTRERVPLDWAGTQNNLGVALAVLGERIGEAAMLSEAVEVCCLALEERTQERVPLEWAVSWGNLGFARSLLGAGLADLGMAEMGLEQLVAAITALGEGGHASHAMHCKARLPVARAAVARMKQGGVEGRTAWMPACAGMTEVGVAEGGGAGCRGEGGLG